MLKFLLLSLIANCCRLNLADIIRVERDDGAWPEYFSVDITAIRGFLESGSFRSGFPSTTNSCDRIRGLPTKLGFSVDRSFYKRYTEAYNIPVLGSAKVTDDGMRRACYVLRFVFADRFDLRVAAYKMNVRVAVIADSEGTTSIPEHGFLPADWDDNTRGVGSTAEVPVTSAGDDNLRCDRVQDTYYPREEILLHELAHTLHLLAANFQIPGFGERLRKAYDKAISRRRWMFRNGVWSYAATNEEEYFAVAVVFYFNSYNRNDYKLIGGYVRDRATLKRYDPDVYKLVEEVFPCGNEYIHRCDWINSVAPTLRRIQSKWKKTQADCPIVHTIYGYYRNGCFRSTCEHDMSHFAMKGKTCYILDCGNGDINYNDVSSVDYAWDVFEATCPQDKMAKGEAQTLRQNCVRPVPEGRCVKRSNRQIKNPWRIRDAEECRSHGGCPARNKCYYPQQDCRDLSSECFDEVQLEACELNIVEMADKCPVICGLCNLEEKDLPEEDESCVDWEFETCKLYKDEGLCTDKEHRGTMKMLCPKMCNLC